MKLIVYIALVLILGIQFPKNNDKIIRMDSPVLTSEIQKVIPEYIDFQDTLMNDTLWTHLDRLGNPIQYSRKITTGVCIDGKCRLVRINLYWNSTGRYLGFELPTGEYLSKTEHDPFTKNEYDRLHKLLGDPQSALANYSIEELVPAKKSSENKVDAVSSATIAAVLDYIVEGAVYTTYTLWHICHGPTKRVIEEKTAASLNPEFALSVLNSKNLRDVVWVLNHISPKTELTPALKDKLLEFISGDDVYLAERSLNSLQPELLNDQIQLQLAQIYSKTGFLQKRLIIQKLIECHNVNDPVAEQMAAELKNMNGTLVKTSLELFSKHEKYDEIILMHVYPLLKNENRFIANQAFLFLEEMDAPDKKTIKYIDKYKRKTIGKKP